MAVQQTSEDSATLPSTNAELSHVLDATELTAIGSPDSIYASVNNTLGYGIMQFEYDATGKTSLVVTWQDGKADIAPSSSPVKLQIYKVAAPAGWEDLDSNNAAAAGATFTLTGTKAVLTDYVDGSNIVYVRVYQATSVGGALIDSYTSTGDYDFLTDVSRIAMSNIYLSDGTSVGSAKFKLNLAASVTGTLYAEIKSYTGTPGTTAKPDGAALGTSETIDPSTLTVGSDIDVTFTFSSPVANTAATYYEIIIRGDTLSGNIKVIGGNAAYANHNAAQSADDLNWTSYGSGFNIVFYVYGA